ncbi:zf-HC2 domain-containing protein [Dactylosporangium sp. AC04546]|uniref:zf-HC2 domain-containing protein n=1 Tax=Dactylosporangium sp. AC04546 TaxID=2862460 RepID=UPI001EDE494E|nr:zf-HC2 domain-containing protein [Dactylosporangium sp. AC04546]WVK84070.1 zf-HC2 domain-containing protein [Dactylosporangium sp. AC04546]
MRCEHLHDSGVYVLGALSPPEREAYERHLADCAECRAEVAEFADLPGLLGRLDRTTATGALDGAEPAPPDAAGGARWAGPIRASSSGIGDPLLPRVLDRAAHQKRAERRRRRWQTVGTALVAACLGVLGVLGVRAVGEPDPPNFVAMEEVAESVPVTARLALEPAADGTVVRMQCAYKGGGYGKWTYKLVVVPKSGQPEEIDSWTAGYGDEYDLKARTSIPRADIARVEIRKGDDTPLLALAT